MKAVKDHFPERLQYAVSLFFPFLLVSLLWLTSLALQAAPKYNPPLFRLDSLLYEFSRQGGGGHEISPELQQHRHVVELIGRGVLGIGEKIDSAGLFPAVGERYAHPALLRLAEDVQRVYTREQLTLVHKEIVSAMRRLHKIRPQMPLPEVLYTHVSGFHQRIVVAEGFLSVALDFYLGKNYSLYRTYFSPWQQRRSDIEHVAVDAVLGWLISEYPEPREQALSLRDKFLYWGKIYTLMHKAFPWRSEAELFGFTLSEWQWLKENKKHLLRNAKERGEFDSTAPVVIDKYFTDLPQGAALPKEAPRLIGPWLAYKYYKKL